MCLDKKVIVMSVGVSVTHFLKQENVTVTSLLTQVRKT